MSKWKRPTLWASIFLGFVILVALGAPFLASDQPILCKTESGWHLNGAPSSEKIDFAIYPPVRFSPQNIDLDRANYQPPMTTSKDGRWHFLGTDLIGRDVAAGLIHGTRLSLTTAMIAMLLSMLIGLPLGLIGGYTGNSGIRAHPIQIGLYLMVLVLLCYVMIYFKGLALGGKLILILVTFLLITAGMIGGRKLRNKSNLPLDLIIMRGIEVVSGLPGLLILLAISAILESKSVLATGLIIGLLRWPIITLLSRNEVQKTKQLAYVQSARALGMGDLRITLNHILPNILTPIIVTLIMGLASAILIESALSFLGIGVALEEQTWGSLLSESRRQIKAWWLAVFPGGAIFLTIMSLHTIARTSKTTLN
jgi:peptide/nickel transport system permease protein